MLFVPGTSVYMRASAYLCMYRSIYVCMRECLHLSMFIHVDICIRHSACICIGVPAGQDGIVAARPHACPPQAVATPMLHRRRRPAVHVHECGRLEHTILVVVPARTHAGGDRAARAPALRVCTGAAVDHDAARCTGRHPRRLRVAQPPQCYFRGEAAAFRVEAVGLGV